MKLRPWLQYRSKTNLPELVKIKAKRTLLILHLRKIEAKRILFIQQIGKIEQRQGRTRHDCQSRDGSLRPLLFPLGVRGERPPLCQALFLAGKLVRGMRINTVAPGRLVHILDESTQRRFLVDTGAAYSTLPFSPPASSPALVSQVQMDWKTLAGESAGYPWFSTAAASSLFAGQGPVPHHRCGFLEALQAAS
jgi:hypothetical protein